MVSLSSDDDDQRKPKFKGKIAKDSIKDVRVAPLELELSDNNNLNSFAEVKDEK